MPGARYSTARDANPAVRRELEALRRNGELAEYSNDELRTVALHVSWVKPCDGGPGAALR